MSFHKDPDDFPEASPAVQPQGEAPAQAKPEVAARAVDERAAFEQWYTINAFDYVRNPVGSRDCGLQWAAWQARAAAQGKAPCIGEDPTCPCQDGDSCHYTGKNAWPLPSSYQRQKADETSGDTLNADGTTREQREAVYAANRAAQGKPEAQPDSLFGTSEDEEVIAALSRVLAEVVYALRGEPPPGVRFSYHDLAERIEELKVAAAQPVEPMSDQLKQAFRSRVALLRKDMSRGTLRLNDGMSRVGEATLGGLLIMIDAWILHDDAAPIASAQGKPDGAMIELPDDVLTDEFAARNKAAQGKPEAQPIIEPEITDDKARANRLSDAIHHFLAAEDDAEDCTETLYQAWLVEQPR
ncbi:hypothetical protein BH09PSE6_BH09PSE6_17890 [soil metagenome]